MADYKVSTLIETNAGQVARDVDKAAASIERVGTSSTRASGGTNALTLAQQKLELANRKVVETGEKVDRLQRRGATSTATYTQALERHLRAQQAVLTETAKIERLQNRQQSPGGRSGGGGLAGLAVGGVAGYFTGQAVGRYLMDSKDAASSLNETMAKSTSLFGPYAQSVERFGQTANTQIGESKQAAIEAATAFGTLFHSVDIGAADSSRMSVNLTKLSADLAAYAHDTDATKATQALQSAIRGQFDTLGQYGIVLTTADVKQKALQMGLVATVKDGLTPAAQAQAVYALAMEKSSAQTGTFAARAGEAAGKAKILAATSENAKSVIGQGLIPVMTDLTDIAQKDLLPVIEALGGALGFLGEHDTLRHVGELALVMIGLAKAVDITAAAYGRLTATATTAAAAEGAAASPGAFGRLGQAGRAGAGGLGAAVAGAGAASFAVIAAGIVPAVLEIMNRRGIDSRIGRESALADAGGPVAQRKQAAAYGVTPYGKPGQYLTDPNKDPDETQAGIALLERAVKAEQAAAAARSVAGARTGMSRMLDRRQAQAAAALALARDPQEQARAAGAVSVVFGTPFAKLPGRTQGDVSAAKEAQRQADLDVRDAQRAVDKARRGAGGASASSMLAAEASVRAAQNALRKRGGDPAAENLRLQAAEARLAELRSKGGVDTDKLRAAEERLKEARKRAGDAAEDTKKAAATTALGVQDLLGKVTGQAKDARNKRDDVRKLIKAGVSEPVIEELAKLEQQAPGTFDRLAKEINPKIAKALNDQYAALNTFQKQFQDEVVQYARRSAEASADAVVAAYAARGLAIRSENQDPNEHGAPKPRTPGVTAGVTAPPALVAGPTRAPTPVIVAPRQTTHHNVFPNVKTSAQIRAEQEKLERLDALR